MLDRCTWQRSIKAAFDKMQLNRGRWGAVKFVKLPIHTWRAKPAVNMLTEAPIWGIWWAAPPNAAVCSGISVQIRSYEHLYATRHTCLFGFYRGCHLLAEEQTQVDQQINGFLIPGRPDRREPTPLVINKTLGRDARGRRRRCFYSARGPICTSFARAMD